MTNQEVAQYTLDALKQAGADHAQCVVSQGKTEEINVDSGKFSLMRTMFNSSLRMKALKGQRKGSISVNRLDKASIDVAVADCMAAAESAAPDDAEQIAPYTQNMHFSSGPAEPNRNLLYDRMDEYIAQTRKLFPKIMLEQLVADFSYTESLYCNTNQVEYDYTHGEYTFSSTFSAQDSGQTSSSSGSYVILDNLDTPFLELDMQKALLSDSEKQIFPSPFPGKIVGSIVLTPDCLADFLGMAFDSFLRDSALIDQTSPWKDALGKSVADSRLTVSAVPLEPRIVSGERITADGYRTENMDIIKDGMLQHFLLTQYGANKTGLARGLNSGQNFLVQPGDASFGSLISSVKRGVLVGRFSGGQPGTNGDFSGVAKNSFLIENGRIVDALSETMIAGNLAELLQNITGISKETVCDGMHILPWMAFKNVTISGK